MHEQDIRLIQAAALEKREVKPRATCSDPKQLDPWARKLVTIVICVRQNPTDLSNAYRRSQLDN